MFTILCYDLVIDTAVAWQIFTGQLSFSLSRRICDYGADYIDRSAFINVPSWSNQREIYYTIS